MPDRPDQGKRVKRALDKSHAEFESVAVGWFKKPHRGEEGSKPAPEPLSARIDDLERALRTLKSEWLDTLDRLQRLHARIVKRTKVDEPEEPATEREEPQQSNGHDPIALRRSRLAGPGQR